MNFTGIVKYQMQERGITPAGLASKMGFTVQYIYKLLQGKKRWNETTMTRACEALGIEIEFAQKDTGPDEAAIQ